MALKDHKKGITRLFLLMVVMTLLCFGVFSCCTYLEQQSQTYVDMGSANLVQLEDPADTDPAMCMETSLGTIVAVLYPEQAPDYVAQFTQLAEAGYYNNTYIFSVEEGVYFEAGSPNQDGSLAVATDDTYEKVERETSADLWPFRGAFCVPTTTQEGSVWDRITSQTKTYCGSRFVVCNSIVFDEATKEELSSVSENAEKVTNGFLERGGVPNYSQQMTVFAQAYGTKSFDTIDAITSVATAEAEEEDGYTPPVEDIQILTITIGTYGDFWDKVQ